MSIRRRRILNGQAHFSRALLHTPAYSTYPFSFFSFHLLSFETFLKKLPTSSAFSTLSSLQLYIMNSREVAIVTTATVFGALASAIALRFFYLPKKHAQKTNSSENGIVSNDRSSRNPFDPSKRKGLV